MFEGDPAMLRRVLRDLWVAGGTHPAPQSCRLESAARRASGSSSGWCVRAIRSTPALLHALFEPFDLDDDDTGITIGLYLARALVVAHGGTIGVDQDDDPCRALGRASPPPEPEHQEDR